MMLVRQDKKDDYWSHFVKRWAIEGLGGGYGITGPRLRKIKATIMADEEFWDDVYWRHGGNQFSSPEDMAEQEPDTYEHCLGNFWGMIYQTLVEQGLVK